MLNVSSTSGLRRRSLASAIAAVGLAMSSAAVAESRLQEVPISITVLDSEALETSGVHSLADLIPGRVPGLLVQPAQSSASTLNLSIRGISGRDFAVGSAEPGVAVFVDGVYLGRQQGLAFETLDLEQVEVLRGPQGTLYGRNTAGGAVRLVTRGPAEEFGIRQHFGFGGEYDEFRSVTHLDTGVLAGGIRGKISYAINEHDGWVENGGGTDNSDNFWLKDNEALRIALSGQPIADVLSIDYAYDSSDTDTTQGLFRAGARVESVGATDLQVSRAEAEGHTLNVDLKINDDMFVESITGYRELDSLEFEAGLAAATIDQEQEQFTQEIRLSGTRGELSYVVGASYFDEEVELAGSRAIGRVDSESFAVFAQGTMPLSDVFSVTVGWRETADDKRFESDSVGGLPTQVFTEYEEDNTDFLLGFNFLVSDDVMGFARYSTGFRSGGASLLDPGLTAVDAETVGTLEAGFEYSNSDNTYALTASVFTTDYDDRQFAGDGDDAEVDGVDVAFTVRPLESLAISGSYHFLDVEFTNTDLPLAPRDAGRLAIDLVLADLDVGKLSLHTDYLSMSQFYTGSSLNHEDSRDLLNARLRLQGVELEGDSGQIEIGVWGKNLTDHEYVVNSVGNLRAYGEPRTYGVDVIYTY